LLEIYVDADACPVKQEVCRVAKRYRLKVTLVSNSWMRVSDPEVAKLVVVEGQFDAADNWIVEHVSKDDIVVTTDIPLAYRCVKSGALERIQQVIYLIRGQKVMLDYDLADMYGVPTKVLKQAVKKK
jgi:uncharacterized protein YaiI (UPF0178 family)